MPPLTSPQIRPAILWGSWVALDGLPFQIPSNGNNFPPSIWMPNIGFRETAGSDFFFRLKTCSRLTYLDMNSFGHRALCGGEKLEQKHGIFPRLRVWIV